MAKFKYYNGSSWIELLPTSGGTLSGPLYFGDAYHRISQEDGSTITRAGGGTISVPTGSGTKGMSLLIDEGGDFGLLYVGSDGSVIANSGDNGYIFKVYDKDMNSSDFTSGTGFLFGVKQGGAGSAVAGDLEVGSVIYEGGTALSNKYQAKGNYAGTAVATQSANGLMSSTDKTALDGIVASLNDDDSDSVVNRLKDVLSVFQDYPEGTTVLSALNSKLSLSGGAMTGTITGAQSGKGIVFQSTDTDNSGWAEGVYILDTTHNNYSTLTLGNSDKSDLLALVHNGTSNRYYFDVKVDGTNHTLNIPARDGTIAVNGDSQPASDVYPWAKEATKPSYNFSEIGAGNIIQGNGSGYILWRNDSTYNSGIYYSTPSEEAVVFANKNLNGDYSTQWIFAYTNPTDRTNWGSLTNTVMQIKKDSVAINKLVGTNTAIPYNLDVNGSANATTVTVATKCTMQYNSTEDCLDFIFA